MRKILSVPKTVAVVVCTLLAVLTCLGGFYTVDQGYRAVITRFGKVIGVSDPGLHFKLPWVDKAIKMEIRQKKRAVQGLMLYSRDVQAASVTVSINYALNPASVADIYEKYGVDYAERIIDPQFLTKPKDAFGRYAAVEIIQNREVLMGIILKDMQEHFNDMGILVSTVNIEEIDFSDEYERSVEERMKAEVEVAKVRQNLERERINADMVRTKAQGAADARIAQSKAEAESIRMVGLAEAEAIQAKSRAFAENPNYVQLIQAEKWNGTLPTTVIPNSTLPIINTTPKQEVSQ